MNWAFVNSHVDLANGRQLGGEVVAIRAAWDDRMGALRRDAAARRVATLALEQRGIVHASTPS